MKEEKVVIEEEEVVKFDEKKGCHKKMNDNKSQFEYGKKLFIKALKHLNMFKINGSSASSEFITKYIKDLDIEHDQTHNNEEDNDNNDN